MGLPNRAKFFFASGFLEAVNRRIPGKPHAEASELVADLAHQILDVCGGTGYLARLVARKHPQAEVVVLDLSPELLTAGRRRARSAKLDNLFFVLGDATDLPFDDSSVDLVTSSFGLHELSRSARAAALHEVRRVLRPGGTFLVVDLDDARFRRLFRTYLRLSHTATSREILGTGLPEAVTQAGFEVSRHLGARGSVLPYQLVIASTPRAVQRSSEL
jgi:ubiquinone/menaquinone biosynthesis C-methylase UbiE